MIDYIMHGYEQTDIGGIDRLFYQPPGYQLETDAIEISPEAKVFMQKMAVTGSIKALSFGIGMGLMEVTKLEYTISEMLRSRITIAATDFLYTWGYVNLMRWGHKEINTENLPKLLKYAADWTINYIAMCAVLVPAYAVILKVSKPDVSGEVILEGIKNLFIILAATSEVFKRYLLTPWERFWYRRLNIDKD
ncbi:MAG: hypothetical protein ABIE94_06970 [archaeon]